MKKILQSLAIVLALTLSAAAAASTVIFKESAGAAWEKPDGLKQTLLNEGLLKGDAFPAVVLAQIAHKHAKENNLPGAKMTPEAYNEAFGLFNQLDINRQISVAEFQRRALSGEFKLPPTIDRDATFIAAAKTSAPPTTLAPAAAAPQVQTPPTPVVTAENVQKNLDKLSTSVDDKYSGIKRRVDELKVALGKAALKSDIAKIVEETQTIVNLTNRVKVVEDRLDHPETGLVAVGGKAQTAFNLAKTASDDVGNLTKKVSELTNSVRGLAKGFDDVWVAIAVIGLIALLAAVMSIVAILRRGPSAKTAAWEDRTPPVL